MCGITVCVLHACVKCVGVCGLPSHARDICKNSKHEWISLRVATRRTFATHSMNGESTSWSLGLKKWNETGQRHTGFNRVLLDIVLTFIFLFSFSAVFEST